MFQLSAPVVKVPGDCPHGGLDSSEEREEVENQVPVVVPMSPAHLGPHSPLSWSPESSGRLSLPRAGREDSGRSLLWTIFFMVEQKNVPVLSRRLCGLVMHGV